MRFRNRQEAGEELVAALSEYRGAVTVVYALPRGGVVLGKIVARELGAPLDLVIPRKIGAPGDEEYAIAAVTETGDVVKGVGVDVFDATWFAQAVEAQRQEAHRRHERYLAGRPRVEVAGKTAIIVDDGIATGLTMKAAIAELKVRKPSTIVVAVPVAPRETIEELVHLVNRVVVLERPPVFMSSIGSYYDSFDQVTDEEVVAMLSV